MYRRESSRPDNRGLAHGRFGAIRRVAFGAVLVGCVLSSGCGRSQDDPDEAFPPIPQTNAGNTAAKPITAEAGTGLQADAPRADGPRAEESASATTETAELSLKLKTGDRFPLMKTVRQHITQFLPEGQVSGWSELQLLMAITVAEQLGQQRRFEVRYQRVRYAHEIGGERVEYDSTRPPTVIPEAAQVYHGMVDNGFSFWLGPDHRVLRVEGFDEFLRRSVAHVPEGDRAAVLTSFERISSEETIANFIDDSIGLLPDPQVAGQPLAVGTRWSPPGRQIVRPVPMYIRTNCRLIDVSPRFARVVISGTISPGTAYGPSAQPASGLQLFIRGGEVAGECTIDLQTGLPIRSQIDRVLEMWVQLDDGTHIRQQKTTSTIIQSFPAQTERPASVTRTQAAAEPPESITGAVGPADERGTAPVRSPVPQPAGGSQGATDALRTAGPPSAPLPAESPEASGALSVSDPQPVRRVPRLVPPQTLQ